MRNRPVGGRLASIALGAAAACALSACGSTHSQSASPSPAPRTSASTAASTGQAEVTISEYAFHPASLTVAAGTRVTFTNRDQTAHTATSTSAPPVFDTGTIPPGQSKSVTVSRTGVYPYFCQFHPFMHGTLRVVK